jgi:hypothetical protein
MDKHARIVQTRISLIIDLMKHGQVSEENYDSTQAPFFLTGSTEDFQQGHKDIPELPAGLNRNVRYIYQIIGNPDVEVTLTDRDGCEWTIMSLTKSLEIYEDYKQHGQTRVFDFAYRYMGMGHIQVVSCDTRTHNLFFHRAGGSNGWDREINFNETVQFSGDSQEIFFLNWFCRFKPKKKD